MKVAFAPRAAADLRDIGERSRRIFGDAVAAALERSFDDDRAGGCSELLASGT
jgi:mRNA-degrading endonuclease RelE of RelBE toxin-antitoxin system